MRGPKEKKERALGERLQLKGERCSSPKCAMLRKPYRPGMHGKKKRKKNTSDFGRQLMEKQKCKVSYGLDERTLRRLFETAHRQTGSTADRLVELLESRLDNVVFRLGLATSRSMARQLIIHGHIAVNGRRVRSPGFAVKVGDAVRVREGSLTKNVFRKVAEATKAYEPPSWLQIDRGKLEGLVTAPVRDTTLPFEVNTLVESFSK